MSMPEAKLKDEILTFLKDSKSPNRVVKVADIASHLRIKHINAEMYCSQLGKQGYVVYTQSGDDSSLCTIRQDGIHFLESGGFTQEEELRILQGKVFQTRADLEEQQIKSVIATNKSTRKAYYYQRRQNKISIRLVAAATILSLATLIKEFWPQQPIIDKETRQILQRQAISQDSLQQTLRRMDSTFERLADSSGKKT